MARDFPADNVANYINLGVAAIGPLIDGAAKVSVAAWCQYDGFDTGANENRILSASMTGVTGVLLGIDGTASGSKVRVGGRSVSTDGFQVASGTTDIGTGTYVNMGGVYDYAGDLIRVYLNGAQEASAAVTFANTSYTHSAGAGGDSVGSSSAPPGALANMMNGRGAEVAVWSDDITTAGFAMVAKGFSPLLVRPESLVFYMPLLGKYSPEIDVVGGKLGTINGTINGAVHPRVLYPGGALAHSIATATSTIAGIDSDYLNDLERDVLTQLTQTASFYLHDLRREYYGAKTGLTSTTINDMVRAFLQTQTGLTSSSLSDLWRAYFVQQGVPSSLSLTDMARYFYKNIGLPN